jgi:hypothetical protein
MPRGRAGSARRANRNEEEHMPDFRVTIDVLNVGPGDVDDLANQIMARYDYDASAGEFVVRVSQKVGDNFYGRDSGDDVIEA